VRPDTTRKAVLAGAAAIGVAGVAALVASKRGAAQPTARRVALIGDSYAVGLGPQLAKLLPDFQYEGHVGTSTSQWVNHAAACGACGDWLAAFKPDVTLVSLGVNDGAKPDPANYQAIARALHGVGSRVVWVEPPASVSAPGVRVAIAALGVPVVVAPDVPMAPDGLHPASYARWAEQAARAVA
jgi:lysophospholipase L1-like esterase